MMDEHEIRDLAQRYAAGVAARDARAVSQLFDDEVDNGAYGKGKDATFDYYVDFFARDYRYSFMQVGTHQVDVIDDDHAVGVQFTRAWSGRPDERGWTDTMVVYFDTYLKRDGQWGFVHRRETLHHMRWVPHEEAVIPGLTDGTADTGSGDTPKPARRSIPKAWEYWQRWGERTAEMGLQR
jgi:uncharacterized protein (TIGR02246 family)